MIHACVRASQVVVLIGIGEVCGVISTQVYVQQLAVAKYRGSIIGAFSMVGGVGILINAEAGGELPVH